MTVDVPLPEIVYTFWDNLDVIVELPAEINKKLTKKPLREHILQTLSKGVLDDLDGKKRRRHAITVNEMIKIIEETHDIKVKKSNLYYHLQVLIDLNIIQELTSVKQGNIITSFFGRTSKLILMNLAHEDGEDEEQLVKHSHQRKEHLEEQDDFKVLLKRMQKNNNSEVNINQIIESMREIRKDRDKINYEFKNWIVNYATELRGLDLDLIELYHLFTEIRQYSEEKRELLEKLDHIMNIRGFN